VTFGGPPGRITVEMVRQVLSNADKKDTKEDGSQASIEQTKTSGANRKEY